MNKHINDGQANRAKDNKDWDEQQLSSESEVTLQKFQSQISSDDDEKDINSFLQKFPLEDRINFVVDKNRGCIIDSRNGRIIQPNYPILTHHQSAPVNNIAQVKKAYISPYSVPKKRETLTNKSTKKQGSTISEESIWDDYWSQSEKIHQNLLMGIVRKDQKLINDLFNKRSNSIPLNVNYKSFDNWTPIHFASLHGNVFALDLLLAHPEIYVNSLTNFKWSALHIAVKNNRIEVIKKLLQSKIDSNFQDQDGYTALHYATELGYNQSVNLLIKIQNIKVDLLNNQGLAPKDLTVDPAILKELGVQCSTTMGFWSKGNRHRQRLLQKVRGQKIDLNPIQMKQNCRIQSDLNPQSNRETGRNLSKKENFVRMYQLLQQNKVTERVGIESFRFYKKIGEGAFGEVYIVKKLGNQKLYALKAIKKQKIFGTNLIKYIKTEKEVLSLIKHPFIVHLHYAFQTEAHLFLVMEYCCGGDLGKMLQKQRRFDEKTVKKYAAEILLALQALHQQRIIYRDLKPDNIVLDQNGHALLTDFGLSKKTTNIDDINKSFCGTPAYLPLEIINKKGHNRMADWYEYGIVLYELLAGLPPFYADKREQLYRNVRAGIVRFPKGSSEDFRDLIKKLLAQNPEKRLGFANDASSIKSHKWFSDIDWKDVYERKLEMPKNQKKVAIGQPIKTKFIEDRTDKYLIEGWSFIGE